MARLWRKQFTSRGLRFAWLLWLPAAGCGPAEPAVDIAASKRASAAGGLQFPSAKPSQSKVRLDPNFSVRDPARKTR